jgi:Pectate lyase superfamily protein
MNAHLPFVLLFCAVAVQPSAAALFPDDSGYVNVRARYGAAGDGKTDDTAAFRKAAEDNVRRLYIPRGIYLLSDTVHFSPKRWILQGEGFGDAARPKPYISTFSGFMDPKAAMGQAFRSSVFNLTIEVGAGNPGAVALHYLNNNQGAVRDVTLRSLDPQRAGRAGLAMVTAWPGPALFKDVTVEGFDFGVWSTISQFSLTFEDLTLRGQREAGFENRGQTVGIRRLRSENKVPALRNSGGGGFVALLESECTGGAAPAAIVSGESASLYVRGLRTSGYGAAISDDGHVMPGPSVAEWSSAPALRLFEGAKETPHLPVEETPDFPLPPPGEWASVADFGGKPITGKDDVPDCGPALQQAIDSGKPVVYFPNGSWAIRSTVVIRGAVQLITGLDNRIRWLTGREPAFRLGDGTPPFVVLERFDGDYESQCDCQLDHASQRALVVRHAFFGHYRNTVPGGKVFIEDVCGGNWDFTGQSVWMRQLNPEARGDAFNVRAVNSSIWALGYKTEGPKTAFTARGGQIEVLAAFLYANRGTDKDAATFELTDTTLTANYVNHLGGHYRPQIRARFGGRLAELKLDLNLSDADNPVFTHRLTREGTVITEATMTKRDKQSPLRAYRHGSYGVKVPVLIVP